MAGHVTTTAGPVSGAGSMTEVAAPAVSVVRPAARQTDDEILGIETAMRGRHGSLVSDATGFGDELEDSAAAATSDSGDASDVTTADGSAHSDGAGADPVTDVAEYREIFATPGEAREARERVAEVSRLDELFFSKNPADHAELARAVAEMDREAFAIVGAIDGGVSGEAGGRSADGWFNARRWRRGQRES